MSEETVPQQGVTAVGGDGRPTGLLQQMEELMAALNADLSALDAELQSTGQERTGRPGTAQTGVGQVGTGQVGAGPVGTGQVGVGQVGTGQVGAGPVGTGQAQGVRGEEERTG